MSQRRLPPPCRYVYVIGPAEGLQKIGVATDPRARLAALQTASPFKLVIHASVAVPFGAAHGVERCAHKALGTVRASGEWFETTPGEAVMAVRSAADQRANLPFDPGVSNGTLPLFAFSRAASAEPIEPFMQPPSGRGGWARIWRVARRSLAAGRV